MVHLVYCDNTGKRGERAIDKIISGAKTAVVRGAAGRKLPHSRVFAGETLYFMEKGSGAVSARAVVSAVANYTKLADDEITSVLCAANGALCLSEKQLLRWHKKCLCIVSFEGAAAIEPPLRFEKQNNMDDWLMIEKIEDVLIGTAIPYNYDNSKLK